MFKVVPEFPNLSCDQNGNVKMNYKDTKNTYNEYINYKGYLVARIKTQGNSFIRMKHRLITQTWLSNPFKLTEVNHIDGVKTNNTLTNLEYITHKNNMIHATKNNLLKNQHNVSLYKNNEFYKEFPSLKELGKYLGVGGLALVSKIKYSKIFNLIKEKDGKVNNFYIEIKNSKGFKKTTNSGKPSVQYFVYDIVNNKYIGASLSSPALTNEVSRHRRGTKSRGTHYPSVVQRLNVGGVLVIKELSAKRRFRWINVIK